jgi:DNA processing protein
MEENDLLKYWLAFSQIKKIGPVRMQKILKYFPDLSWAWKADWKEFVKAGLEENLAQEIAACQSQINPNEELEKLNREEIKVVLLEDNNYPRLLKEIFAPPFILYYRGSLAALKNFCLAVVGTRKYSSYGQQATEKIVGELAPTGITIVSGLALGIDALAHQTCLNSGGQTAAVLGSSLDWQNVYPSTNRHLAQRILAGGGALISEFPLGTLPAKFTFPIRNRIISGLSLGTLVVEAPEESGALITARYALEQNRDVFAVPGSIYNRASEGTNKLIKAGAKMVTSAKDILEELNLQQATQFIASQKTLPESKEEATILKILSAEPTHIDKIANLSKLKINVLSGILMVMEIKGMIRDAGGKNYIKR